MYDPRFYTQTLSDEERQSLILKHLPQVRLLARRIHGRLPETVSLDDLISTGIVGLISAIDRFDPSRDVQLRAYAEHKIRGRILDSLRRLDWAPRQQRQRAKQIQAAIAARGATPAPGAHGTRDRHRTEYHGRTLSQVAGTHTRTEPRAIGSRSICDSETRRLRQFFSGDPNELPSAVFERGEFQHALAAAISELPEIHQTVLSMYYRDELKPQEISKITGLPKSRISWIRTRAIRQLRACMAKLWPTSERRERSASQT